ncbi:hypothetical protein [Microbacterium sp. Bi121]|uniref:hypothetical protein n=1 Tax=Microbacterium sp. Bi121 TaxID=2822348 RepID=UPI001DE6FF18|nr:hypothetical protein [Microbacterium sp. Bi121]CAH0135460.1 hypothetical protein SRABI121_00882 [Microbacterium sp. Bi121]
MRSSAIASAAAAVLALEGLALLMFAVIDLVGLGAGEAASLSTAIALIVLTLIGAAALFAFAAGTRRGRTWARSGGVVLQVLAIAIALASLTVPPVPWPFVLGVGIPGVVGFVLLIASTRIEARRERKADAGDAGAGDRPVES